MATTIHRLTKPSQRCVTPLVLAVGITLLASPTQALAEANFSSRLGITGHGYWLDSPSQDGKDNGAVVELEPGLRWRYQGPKLQTRIDASHQRVWYSDGDQDTLSLNEYSLQNVLTGFDRRARWSLDASQRHTVRAGQGGAIFRDRITNPGELSKTRRLGTGLSLETARHKEAQFALSMSGRKVKSERPQQDDFLGDINSEQYDLRLQTSRDQQYGGLYWRGNGNLSRTEREERERLTRDSAHMLFGVPLLPSVAWTVQGRYEKNNVRNTSFTNEYNTAGTGLEWQFGRVSRINLSYNTVLKGRDDGDFVSADFFIAPSRRTSLSGQWDRRYFGRTAQVNGQYNLRFLTMRLSYTDRVSTRNFLETELIDLGVFVCPDDASDIGACFNLPGADYELGANEQLQQLFDVDVQIRDDVVLNRQGALVIGYSKNRLTTSLNLSSSEQRYQEIDRVDRRHNASLQTAWRLTPHSSIRANVRAYQYNFGNDNREDKSWQYELGWARDLTASSDLNLTARHSKRDSSNDNFDFRENRLSLRYNYRF
ncbi:MAG: TIGR03016 family PEP-CTERM system-associated outer membrane protein [Alkalimonas sp.]|nr:TIGR03016 family PEP-CTERM system-associated outer membrane protein [Alkalimonas sp.]